MIGNFKNLRPKIHESCFIAPTADVIGDVTVGENSSIWHRTVLRGDVNKIELAQIPTYRMAQLSTWLMTILQL